MYTGVRQGCPLSPLLFSLFINNLMDFMKVKVPGVRISQYCINGLLFADDVAFTAQSSADLLNALYKFT